MNCPTSPICWTRPSPTNPQHRSPGPCRPRSRSSGIGTACCGTSRSTAASCGRGERRWPPESNAEPSLTPSFTECPLLSWREPSGDSGTCPGHRIRPSSRWPLTRVGPSSKPGRTPFVRSPAPAAPSAASRPSPFARGLRRSRRRWWPRSDRTSRSGGPSWEPASDVWKDMPSHRGWHEKIHPDGGKDGGKQIPEKGGMTYGDHPQDLPEGGRDRRYCADHRGRVGAPAVAARCRRGQSLSRVSRPGLGENLPRPVPLRRHLYLRLLSQRHPPLSHASLRPKRCGDADRAELRCAALRRSLRQQGYPPLEPEGVPQRLHLPSTGLRTLSC